VYSAGSSRSRASYPPLQTPSEERARLACTARMQKLPADVRPVPLEDPWGASAQRAQQGPQRAQRTGASACRGAVCEICMNEEEEGDDYILQVGGLGPPVSSGIHSTRKAGGALMLAPRTLQFP
jgi:hypothetical protein